MEPILWSSPNHDHFWSRMHSFVTSWHPLLAGFLGDDEIREVVYRYIAAHPFGALQQLAFEDAEIEQFIGRYLDAELLVAGGPA